jgi:putative ABC transport system permease protein
VPLRLDEAASLGSIEGVRSVDPDLGGSAVLVGADGTAVRNGGAPSFGFAFRPDDEALPLVSGRAPRGADEVVVESTTLDKAGLSVGDSTKLVVAGTVQPVTIVGEERFVGGSAGQTMVSVAPDAAREWFAPDGTVQSFSLRAEDGVTQAQLRARVAAALPAGQEAITGATYADETKSQFAEGLGFISTFLLVFAAVSLLVGVFIIFNTFSMLVAQRTRELALLRAVGASRSQVMRVVLGEAAAIGLVGGALGLAGGIGLAKALQLLMGTFGLQFTGGLPVDAVTIVASISIGLVVTLASALLPAWRAGRIAPVAAMRDDVALPERRLRLRGLVGGLLVALGAGTLAYAVAGLEGGDAARLLGVGAFATFIGLVVAAPVLSRPVLHVLGAPGAALWGTVGKLARDNTLRNPRRTSTTAVSLMIGLALVSAFSVLAATTNASIDKLVDDQVTADFVLSGGNSPFPNSVAKRAAELPGVSAVVDQGIVPVRVGEETVTAAGVSGAGLQQAVELDVEAGDITSLDQGRMAVSRGYASQHHLAVGDTVEASVGTVPEQRLVVGAVYADSQAIGSPVLVPRALYERAVPAANQVSYAAFVRADPSADLDAVRAGLTELVKPQLVISVQDKAQFKEASRGQVNQLLGILYAMLALSVIIAALGIVNTLALSVFERTREIGLLRAVGMTRRQLRRTIGNEAVLTALFGAVLGTALGLTLGILLQRVLADQGLDALAVPWGQVAATFVLAGIVGLLAALWPAWRASRLDVIRAVSTD